MRKLKLDVDALRIDTFHTGVPHSPRGTVRGNDHIPDQQVAPPDPFEGYGGYGGGGYYGGGPYYQFSWDAIVNTCLHTCGNTCACNPPPTGWQTCGGTCGCTVGGGGVQCA